MISKQTTIFMSMILPNNALFNKDDLRRIYYPLLMETLLSVTVGIADTMMVSQAGEAAVSGVSCFNTIQVFLVSLFSAFGTGGSVIVGQLIGMGNEKRARFASKELIYLALAVSLFVAFIFFSFKESVMRLIYGSVEEDVFKAAIEYSIPIIPGTISLWVVNLTSIYGTLFFFNGYLPCTGKDKKHNDSFNNCQCC